MILYNIRIRGQEPSLLLPLASLTLCAAIAFLLRRYHQRTQRPSQELDIERAYIPEAAFHGPATKRQRSDGMCCSPTEIEMRVRFTFTAPSRDDPIYEGPTARRGNYVYGGSLLSNAHPLSQELLERAGYKLTLVDSQPRLQKIRGHHEKEQSVGTTPLQKAGRRPAQSVRKRPQDTCENMKEQWPPQRRKYATPETEASHSAGAGPATDTLQEGLLGPTFPNDQTALATAQDSDQSSQSDSSIMERMLSRSISSFQSGSFVSLEPFVRENSLLLSISNLSVELQLPY